MGLASKTRSFSQSVQIKKVGETRDVVLKTPTREDGVKHGWKLSFHIYVTTQSPILYRY